MQSPAYVQALQANASVALIASIQSKGPQTNLLAACQAATLFLDKAVAVMEGASHNQVGRTSASIYIHDSHV